MSTEQQTSAEQPNPRGYAKPVVVAARLDALVGPTTGVVTLPRHLKWSGNPRYNLDQPGRIVDMYRTVLNEAASPDDLHRHIDEATLVGLWPSIWLPGRVREAWEARFPELTRPPRSSAA